MTSKTIRRWLSEFKTIKNDELSKYIEQLAKDEQLVEELYDVFDEDLSPEVIDPICHQLFNFYRSLDVGLQRFALEFVPVLCQTYLTAASNEAANNTQKFGGIEAFLLGIYNIEASEEIGNTETKAITIPVLARASIYHEPPSLTSMALTENALMHYQSDTEKTVSARPVPPIESINSQNRLLILTYITNRYNAHISFMSARSHKTLCQLCSKLCRNGFGSLGSVRASISSGSSRGRSAGRRSVTIAEDLRTPLSSTCLIELLTAVYYIIFNSNARLGIPALEDIHFRASYDLLSNVLLVTNAIRNSLHFNPSGGQPKDGPMGISISLSPAQGDPVFTKDAITNASFRAKKLPEDIDVQDEAGQLDTSYHEEGSEADVVLSLRTSESSDKSKSSPLPKASKGPLKSIIKKKKVPTATLR